MRRESMDGRFDAAILARTVRRLGGSEQDYQLAIGNLERWIRVDNTIASFGADCASGVTNDEMTRRQRARALVRQHRHRGKLIAS